MTRVFVSHSSQDVAQSERLVVWLRSHGFTDVFLDFDKHGGISPGSDWERTLYREIAVCDAVLLILTANWHASRWCFAEFTQARALGKPIFPLIDTPAVDALVSADIQHLDLVHDREDALKRLVAELTSIALNARGGFPWDGTRPPFPGLLAFDQSDAAIYFGRDSEIRSLLERLNARRAQGGAKIIAIMGASGSGKSSLLRAGLLPRLARDTHNWILLPPFRPHRHPLDELAQAIAAAIGDGSSWHSLRDQFEAIEHKDLLGGLTCLARGLRDAKKANEAQILISIDQGEQLFDASNREEVARFLRVLDLLLAEDLPFMAALTLRSDYFGQLQQAGIAAPFEAFSLKPISLDRVRDVIQGPARVAGLVVDEAVVTAAARDAATADALPLLAFALRDLYDHSAASRRLTIEGYLALGDASTGDSPLENVVRRTAEAVIVEQNPSEADLRVLKELFVGRLVRVGEGGVYLTRPTSLAEIPEAARPIVEALVRARLLTSRGAQAEREIEVSHESLLRVWPQLASWLNEEQEFLLGRRQIEEARRLWLSAPKDNKRDALLTGLSLQRAKKWRVEFPQRLSDLDDFIRHSIEREDSIKARRRLLIGTAFAFVLAAALILAGLTILVSNERGQAQAAADLANQQRDKAVQTRALLLADLAGQRNDVSDFATAIPLAKAALVNPYNAQITASPEAERVLRNSLWNLREAHELEIGRGITTTILVFSPNGKTLLTGSTDGVARLWNAQSGELVRALIGHVGAITSAAFSQNGTMIATGDAGGGLRIWHGESGALIRTLRPHDQMITSLEFSRDGSRLLSASWDLTARIDDPSGVERSTVLSGHTNHVWAAHFSKDEQTVVTGAEDGLRFFSAVDGHLIRENRNIRSVMSATYSPAGDAVVTTDRGGNLILWDAQTGSLQYQRSNLNVACVDCAAFSPDGSRIAAGTKGGVTIFDIKTGNIIARTRSIDISPAQHVRFTPNGEYVFSEAENFSARIDRASDGFNYEIFGAHADFIDSITVSADGQTFATGSRDGTVKLWHPYPVAESSYVPFPWLTWAAFSPDGYSIAVAEQAGGTSGGLGVEGGLAFYNLIDHSYQQLPPHHHDYIKLGAFSPDGTRLVTVSQGDGAFRSDGRQLLEPPMVILWDGSKRELIARLDGHTDRVNTVTFSTDGKKLLTTCNDGNVRVWDAATGSLMFTLSGHSGVVNGAAFSPDDSHIITVSSDRTARLWSIQGKLIKVLEAHNNAIRHVAFSPDGSFVATGSDDFTVQVWHAVDGAAVGALGGHGGAIYALFFPSNDRIVSASADGTVRLWNVLSAQPLVVSDKRSYNGGASAVSDDGTLVSMSWGDSEVRIIDIASGKIVTTLKTLPVEQFQNFIPKSHLLMVTSNYGIELWSSAGEKVGEMKLPFAPGHSVYFAASGERFAVNDGRGLRIMTTWTSTAALLQTAQQFSTRDLTTDQRYSKFLK
jgi:WD40 repeat protein